jgi:exonuclease SbcD
MIQMLHLADLHIGMENYGRIDSTTGLHSRLQDYLDRMDEAIAYGLEWGMHLVLVAGDIYKNRSPNPTHQREFARRIGNLHKADIPVFLLTGNHDISSSHGRAHAVEIFDTLAVPGVTIADRPKLHTLETRSGKLQIIALPWVTRHALLTREEIRYASFNEIEAMIRQRLEVFIINSLHECDPTIPTILTMHGTIDGAQPGAERGMTLGTDMVIPRSMLTIPGIDYVALGHIHKHQAHGTYPQMVYPGSIERVDFGERKDDKGCVLVELEKDTTKWQFHPLDARPFISIDVDVRQSSDPQARVIAAVNHQSLQHAVVRVKIQANGEQRPHIHEDAIREHLNKAGAWVVAGVTVDVQRENRGRFASMEQEIGGGTTPRRALELYLESKDTPPKRVETLLAAADELLVEGQSSEG